LKIKDLFCKVQRLNIEKRDKKQTKKGKENMTGGWEFERVGRK
jgi:hypothetical protein